MAHPNRSLGDQAFVAALWVVGAAVAVTGVFHLAAVVVAGVGPGPVPGLADTVAAIRAHPTDPRAGYADPPGSSAALWTVFAVLLGTLLVVVGWVVTRMARRSRLRATGGATVGQLRAMTFRRAVATARRSMSATLPPRQPRWRRWWLRLRAPGGRTAPLVGLADGGPADADLVVPVCRLGGARLYAQHEDSFFVLGPPRSFKTVAYVVPRVLDAPGPLVATSTKNDLVYLTAAARERLGRVHVLDVDGITGWPTGVCWDPVAGCHDPDEALARGKAWAAADPSRDGARNARWFSDRAGEVLAYLLHAAALKPGGSMRDVVRWAADFELSEPAVILRQQGAAPAAPTVDAPPGPDYGTRDWADLLRARTQARAGETVDGLRMTLSGVLGPLTSPKALRTVCPQPGDQVFDVGRFLAGGRDTLYLLSATGASSVAPLVTALADTIVRAARAASQRSAGGRLWPPLAVVLDEAANIAPLPDLPGLMSDSGGRGISVTVTAQSVAQMADRWGREGADAVRAAATCKLYLPGIAEPDLLDELSQASGRYREKQVSVSSGTGHGSVTTSQQWQPVIQPDAIRRLPQGTALMVYRNTPAVYVGLRPWWRRPDAKKIDAGRRQVEQRTGRGMES